MFKPLSLQYFFIAVQSNKATTPGWAPARQKACQGTLGFNSPSSESVLGPAGVPHLGHLSAGQGDGGSPVCCDLWGRFSRKCSVRISTLIQGAPISAPSTCSRGRLVPPSRVKNPGPGPGPVLVRLGHQGAVWAAGGCCPWSLPVPDQDPTPLGGRLQGPGGFCKLGPVNRSGSLLSQSPKMLGTSQVSADGKAARASQGNSQAHRSALQN